MTGIQYDAVIAMRLTASQRDTVRASADAAGMSVSRYCRSRLLGHVIVAHTDGVMVREMRRIGGLLRHAYDAIVTHDPDPDTATAARRDAREALRSLDAAAKRLAQPPP